MRVDDQRVPRVPNTYRPSTESVWVTFQVTPGNSKKSHRAKNLIQVGFYSEVRVLSRAF